MNSNKNNLTSVISFVSLLLSQPRNMLAIIAAASWLIISICFFLSQPDQNEEAVLNDPSSLTAKFWHEYGWQYHDISLQSVHFSNDQHGWAVGDNGTILTTQDGGINWVAARFVEANLPSWYWGISVLCAVVFILGLLGIRAPSRSDAISAMLSSDRPRRGNESDGWNPKSLLGRYRAFCAINVPNRRLPSQ